MLNFIKLREGTASLGPQRSITAHIPPRIIASPSIGELSAFNGPEITAPESVPKSTRHTYADNSPCISMGVICFGSIRAKRETNRQNRPLSSPLKATGANEVSAITPTSNPLSRHLSAQNLPDSAPADRHRGSE